MGSRRPTPAAPRRGPAPRGLSLPAASPATSRRAAKPAPAAPPITASVVGGTPHLSCRANGVFWLALAWGLQSCGSPVSPLPSFELPPSDTSLSPSAVRPPTTAFLCGHWLGIAPHSDSAILLDLLFGRLSENDPIDRIASGDRPLVEQHGGRVLYAFHFPAVRVWIRAGQVPKLVDASQRLLSVFAVADPRRFDWQFAVKYRASHPYTAQDEAKLATLGARIDRRFDSINMLGGVIPNRSVPTLRADPNVEFVEGLPPFPLCSSE